MKPERFSIFRRVNETLFKDDPNAEGDDAAKKRRRRVVILGAAAIATAGVGVYALSHSGGGGEEKAAHVDRTQAVTAIAITSHEFHPRVALQGEARPRRDFQVYAPASGVRILQLLADEGDYVRAGQPLARLDTALSNAQSSAAQASVASAEAAATRARGEYERAESIRDSGALSTEAIEQRRAAAGAADAQLAAARAQLAEVNARLQGGYVRAPAAGLVISRTAQIGRPVDGQVLFRIAGDNALEVAAEVAEADVLALRNGQRATFRLVDGTSVEGRLRRGPAAIDSRTRTGQALFDLPARSNVRAGMYLRGEAELSARPALAVPQSSILYDDGQAYVFVIDAENHARRVAIATGLREGDMVEITGGIEEGQRVVGSGAAFLQDGDMVRPIDPVAPAPAATAGETELRGREG